MLEEMIRKLVDLPMMERCFIALILTTDDESAWTYMTRVNEHPDLRTFAVVEACRVGAAAGKGKRREEFLTDLLASLASCQGHAPSRHDAGGLASLDVKAVV